MKHFNSIYSTAITNLQGIDEVKAKYISFCIVDLPVRWRISLHQLLPDESKKELAEKAMTAIKHSTHHSVVVTALLRARICLSAPNYVAPSETCCTSCCTCCLHHCGQYSAGNILCPAAAVIKPALISTDTTWRSTIPRAAEIEFEILKITAWALFLPEWSHRYWTGFVPALPGSTCLDIQL